MAKKFGKSRNQRDNRVGNVSPSVVQPTDGPPIADQILLDLANGLRDLDERIGVLEHKFDAFGSEAGEEDEETLMDLRMTIARLSGELTRVSVELKGQIAELASQFESINPTDISPDLASDESFKDLSADSPARIEDPSPSGNRLDGWQPAD